MNRSTPRLACVATFAFAALFTMAASPAIAKNRSHPRGSASGKYCHLLKKIYVPQDKKTYGHFHDYGYYNTSSWAGHHNLPPGYWVYKHPHWYIWKSKCHRKPGGGPSPTPSPTPSPKKKYRYSVTVKPLTFTSYVNNDLDQDEYRVYLHAEMRTKTNLRARATFRKNVGGEANIAYSFTELQGYSNVESDVTLYANVFEYDNELFDKSSDPMGTATAVVRLHQTGHNTRTEVKRLYGYVNGKAQYEITVEVRVTRYENHR